MKWIDRSIVGPKFGNEAWPYIELGRSKIDPISRRVSGSPIERALLVIAVIVYTNNREIKRVFTGHAATISTRVACICSCFLDSGNSNGESYRVQRRRTNVSVGYQARGCREDWTKFGFRPKGKARYRVQNPWKRVYAFAIRSSVQDQMFRSNTRSLTSIRYSTYSYVQQA